MTDAIEHAEEATVEQDCYMMNGISCDLCGRVYEYYYEADACESRCIKKGIEDEAM